MAELTITEAARVCGVNRSTLQRAIQAGRLSLTQEHRVDTAELLRAGFTLHAASAPQLPHVRHAVQQRAAPQPAETAAAPQPVAPAAGMPHEAAVLQQRIAALERENALLREVLEDVRQRSVMDQHTAAWVQQEFAAARQAHAAEMERYDRLLAAPPAAPGPVGGGPLTPAEARGAMRQRIIALLQAHPEGLSPSQVQQHLTVDKPLTNTLAAMVRDGLLRRVSAPGRYVTSESTHT